MEEHVLGITRLVNHLLGPLVLALLHTLHIAPDNPELPIPQHVVMGLVVLVIGTLVALFLRSRLSVEKPGASQQIAEMFLTNPLGIGNSPPPGCGCTPQCKTLNGAKPLTDSDRREIDDREAITTADAW